MVVAIVCVFLAPAIAHLTTDSFEGDDFFEKLFNLIMWVAIGGFIGFVLAFSLSVFIPKEWVVIDSMELLPHSESAIYVEIHTDKDNVVRYLVNIGTVDGSSAYQWIIASDFVTIKESSSPPRITTYNIVPVDDSYWRYSIFFSVTTDSVVIEVPEGSVIQVAA